MNIDEFFSLCRGRLDDEVRPFLWLESDLISYTNRRVNEFARRTEYYRDHTTALICSISVLTTADDYPLDSRVISVKRVMGSWNDLPLRRTLMSYLDVHRPGWERDTHDDPIRYLLDRTVGYITLYPYPKSVGTLSLDVTRLPLNQITRADIGKSTPTTLEFPTMWVEDLVDGILASAFAKPDSQTRNPQMAQYHLSLWEKFLQEAKGHLETERTDRAFMDSIGQEDTDEGWDGVI